MNQIDETREQHMKSDLIYSVCATNHIIVSRVMGSSGLVKLKQPPPTLLYHTHTHARAHARSCTATPPPVRSSLCSLSNQAFNDCSPSDSLLRTGPLPSVRLLLFLMQAIRTQPQ